MEGRSIDSSISISSEYHSISLIDSRILDESISSLGLRPLSEWKVITFPDRIGLYILPDLLTLVNHSLSFFYYHNCSNCGHIDWMRRGIKYSMDGNNKTNIALHSDKP